MRDDARLSFRLIGLVHGDFTINEAYRKGLKAYVAPYLKDNPYLITEEGSIFTQDLCNDKADCVLRWPQYWTYEFNQRSTSVHSYIESKPFFRFDSSNDALQNVIKNTRRRGHFVARLSLLLEGVDHSVLSCDQNQESAHDQDFLLGLCSLAFAMQVIQHVASPRDTYPPKTVLLCGLAHEGPLQVLLQYPEFMYDLATGFMDVHQIGYIRAERTPCTGLAFSEWIEMNPSQQFRRIFGLTM